MASDSEEAPFARAVLITLAVLALYVLSHRTCVARQSTRGIDGGLSRRMAAGISLLPHTWTASHCKPVGKALNWYLQSLVCPASVIQSNSLLP